MNTQLFNMYKDSEKGKKMIALFEPESEDMYNSAINIYTKFPVQSLDVHSMAQRVLQWYTEFVNNDFCDDDNCNIFEEFDSVFDGYDSKSLRCLNADINVISLALFYKCDYFKPLLYPHNFPFIQHACDKLGIELPPIPRTKDYRQYLYYYFDICTAFNKFQQENNLSDAEFCAALYDFSTILDDEKQTPIELPAPTNIWFVGASKEDIKGIQENGVSESIWQCSERTRRGDIVVMYALSPYSCIHSIWRASTSGIFNPFDYYQNRTKVQDGIIVPPITSKELKAHPYFSQLPIVKKNLQGINGVELSAQDYSELLKWIADKGFDITPLPKLLQVQDYTMPDVQIEKDVEEKILIPALERLGYTPNDYTRQLVQKFGRGEKGIPDFVFFPKELMKDNHNAPFIIEAKLDMRNSIQEQDKAFRQAFSYADKLHSTLFGICDKERLIIYSIPKDGAPNIDQPIFENHWAVINTNQTVFQHLKKLIGRETINPSVKI